jgi:glutaminyl-peptide cyclotransferase
MMALLPGGAGPCADARSRSRNRAGRPHPAASRGLLAVGLALFLAGCGASVPQETVEILRILPHDPGAYTQGLVLHEGRFYESTGTYGGSTLREVEVETGQVLRQVRLPDDEFGEGLALVGERLIQITWQEGVAYAYDRETFTVEEVFRYDGNGWGLCYDGSELWMTTGGSMLVRRDPTTFEVLGRVPVTLGDRPLYEVNELACVGDYIYGNVFQSDRIVRIRKATGEVVAEIDAAPLNAESGRPMDPEAVLNGIAWNHETDTFFLTGKRWPTMFEVRFVPR